MMAGKKVMRISIIIINWNGKKWLETCLNSMVNQEISEDYEVIVVDNGSSDDSVKYARREFPEVNVISLDRNLGFAGACNVGLNNAKGEYLVFVNNDTCAGKDWLKNLVQAADQNPQFKILCSIQQPGLKKDEVLTLDCFLRVDIIRSKPSDRIVETLFASGGCFLLRRDWISHIGYLFDPSYFTFYEDTDLSLRSVLAGGKIGYVKDSVIWHYMGGSSSGYSRFWSNRIDTLNAFRSFQKLFSKEKYKKIFLARILYLLFRLAKRPWTFRENMGMLAGFIDFLIYRKEFIKKDKKNGIKRTIDEDEFLRNLNYRPGIGWLLRRIVFQV